MTAQQLVATFSETELSEVCAAINTIQSGSEVSAATSDDGEEEAIQFLTKLNRTSLVAKSAGSTSKGGDKTHLVPMAATGNKASTIISVTVTRLPITRADQEATQLKCALAKVNAPFNGHHNRMFSLTEDDAPKSPPLFRVDTNDEWFAKRKV